MRTAHVTTIVLAVISATVVGGCASADKVRDLEVQNRTQQKRITELENQQAAAQLERDQLIQQLLTAQAQGGTQVESLRAEIAALEKAIAEKNSLITSLQGQLLRGGAPLPVELDTMLQDFAKNNEMVTYDPTSGVVKFKSDLLFEPGSDVVAPGAFTAVKSLCTILNSPEGRNFDAIIAGHTDDIPIRKTETKAKHPTNWHLSSHRGISVLDIMTQNGIEPDRLSVRAFGEYRAAAPNTPGKKGNPLNRRVEIFIVPHGT